MNSQEFKKLKTEQSHAKIQSKNIGKVFKEKEDVEV